MSGEARRVGRVLFKALVLENKQLEATLSHDCKCALQCMAETGAAPSLNCVQELEHANALARCAAQVSASELDKLRRSLGAAALASGTSAELMALWAIVHDATKDALVKPLKQLQETTGAATAVDARENAASIGRLLLLAFSSSMALSSAVSVELQDSVHDMAERGTPLAAELVHELQAHAVSVASALSSEQLAELQAHCGASVLSAWSELAVHIRSAASQLVHSPVLTAAHQGVVCVYNAPLTKVVAQESAERLDAAFTASREGVERSLAAMASGLRAGACTSFLAALPPLLRFEILRDFCQTASLFFTNLYSAAVDHKGTPVVRGIQVVFRAIYGAAAANFSALWSDQHETLIDVGYFALLALILLAYISCLWFAISGRHLHKRSDEIRRGHEGTTWAQLAQTQQTRVKLFTYVITACLTIHLIARYGNHSIWPLVQVVAVALLATFTLPLPFLLVRAIGENRPTGSPENPRVTYDLDGTQVVFDERVYARLVANDPAQQRCPYRSLYAGFESTWSYYKVLQLLFKVALILPLVSMPQTGVRGAISAAIYSLVVLVTSYSTPFSDPLNNVMEISGKVAALVTCLGGTLLGFSSVSTSAERVVGTVVNCVNAVNLVVMLGIFLFGMQRTRRAIKNRLGTLTFSDTVRDIQDAPARSIVPRWDLSREAKHRAWQAFWKSVLLSLQDARVVQRFSALEQAVCASGLDNIKSHWAGQCDPYVASLRIAARRLLEGVDVYWNDASSALDGHLDSKTYFGKMYVQPYPFHCVVVYDDAKDEAIIRDDKFSALLFQNFSPRIANRRLVRQRLRALSAYGVAIHFPFAREEHVVVEDGTVVRTTTDAQGHTHTRTETRYSTVAFTCYYTAGVITVRTNSIAHAMADGFHVLMTYSDGYGDAVAPHTGKTHRQTNRVAAMGPEYIGLTHEFVESPQLQHILVQTQTQWIPPLAALQEQHRAYREQLVAKHRMSTAVLGDGFWYFVFNNAHLSRQELEQYLRTEETNPVLQDLPSTHRTVLDVLYARMDWIHSHPAHMLWFVFWEDVFARNGDMARLAPFKHELDPIEPGAMCYRVLPRDELVAWLHQRKLRGRPFSLLALLLGRKCLFHDKLLQLLYEQMHRYTAPHEVIMTTTDPQQQQQPRQILHAQNKVQPMRVSTHSPDL